MQTTGPSKKAPWRRLARRLVMRCLQAIAVTSGLFRFAGIRPVGQALGSLQYHLSRGKRAHYHARMADALTNPAPGTLRNAYRENTRAVLEVLALYSRRRSDGEIRRASRIEGIEHLQRLSGGAILLGAHQGNGVLLPLRLAIEGYPVAVAIRESRKIPPGFFSRGLGRYGVLALDADNGTQGLKDMIRALRRGYLLYILMDQGSKNGGVEVEFLGRTMAAPAGPAVLARRCQVPIISAAVTAASPAWCFHLAEPVRLPPRDASAERDHRDVQLLADLTADQIRSHPELWTWHHRRWSRLD